MTDVLRFPPLPPLPSPPASSLDERQQTFNDIIGNLTSALSQRGGVATVNTTTGFHASAVDLGYLQNVIGDAIALFDMAQVRERWSVDLFDWIRRTLTSSIQRCKQIHFDLEENGIRITLDAQDDRGYYHYEFDVFPGKS